MNLPQENILDKKWFAFVNKTGSFETYRFLDGNEKFRNKQQKLFFMDNVKNPILDYPLLKKNYFKGAKRKLEKLKKTILLKEKNLIVKKAYELKLNEKIIELEMLEAVARKDFKGFMNYSIRLYGQPSKKIFNYIILQLELKIKKQLDSNNINLRKIARELWNILPKKNHSKEKLFYPNGKTRSLVKHETLKEFGGLVELKKTTKNFTALEIKKIFVEKLKELNLSGWKIKINSVSDTRMYVDQKKKTIVIPELKKAYVNYLRYLLIHEIGTHILRRENGERSKLQLLGLGLNNIEMAEEGIATVRGQALNKNFEDFSGIDGFLAVSLALGLDGKRKDFRETFETMKKYYLFNSLLSGKEFKEAEKYADLAAWNRCIRTFRGTNCKIPGICFTKDIIYYQGNINIWKALQKNPAEIKRFSIGKYDPANPRHIWILEQLNITEDDLENIEENRV